MPARLGPWRGAADWAELVARVERASRVIGGESAISPERARELLDERARALARPAAAAAQGEILEIVTFRLADETYGIEAPHLLAVFRVAELAALPGAEPPVFGLSVWRGALLTVLDLRSVLGLSTAALNDLSRILVLGGGPTAFGILADAVGEVVRLRPAEIQPLPGATGEAAGYVRGVTGNALIVLDGRALLRLHQ